RLSELVRAELDGERAGVILDRRDVVDRFAQALVQEPLKRGLLDVDQIGKVEDVLETRETGARARRSDLGGQEMKPPLEMWCENWLRRADGHGQRDNGATRQGTREPHFCVRVALRNPPNAAGSVANARPVFQAESELLRSDPEGSDPSLSSGLTEWCFA